MQNRRHDCKRYVASGRVGSGSNSDWDDHARRARSSRYLGFVMLSGTCSCGWASMQEQEQKGREDAGDGICFA